MKRKEPALGMPPPVPKVSYQLSGKKEYLSGYSPIHSWFKMEAPRRCTFCGCENPPYTCPRCHQPYCKTRCYRSESHLSCSERFYKEWISTSMLLDGPSSESKNKMLEILKRVHLDPEETYLDSDDDENADDDDCDADLNDRLLSQLQLDDPDELWNKLTPSDREAVKSVLDNQEIVLWDPWWHSKDPSRLLVSEIEKTGEPVLSRVPDVPEAIPKLRTLTSCVPSETVQYQVLNVLASYAFVTRLYNGDHIDEATESVQILLQLSEALGKCSGIGTAAEGVYKLREHQKDMSLDNRALRLVFDDLCGILKGPEYDQNCHYVMAALSDTLHLLKTAKHKNSENRKQIRLAIKKVEYLLSWTLDYGIQLLKNNIPALQLEIVALTENIQSLESTEKSILNRDRPKIIEL